MNHFVRKLLPWRFWPSTIVLRWITRRSRGEVLSGPFAGMRYAAGSVGSSYVPKLLGTYEMELARPLAAVGTLRFDRIVDVGAAEGYYAVGLARAIPDVRVVAFETNPAGRDLLCRMAELNGVRARIDVRGHCDLPALQLSVDSEAQTLVIMDVEGAEKQLLNPARVPGLRAAHVLVEIHDHADPGIGVAVRARFAQTHRIEKFEVSRRRLADYPTAVPWPLLLFMRDALVDAIDEHRHPDSYWYWLVPAEASS